MHVVVADNSRTLLDILRRQIEERGDSVRTFSEGAGAFDYIRGNSDVDVLITSLELQDMSGLQLVWDVCVDSDQFTSNYIIVMSSSSDVDKLIEALDCGADDYLKKPFIPGELFARLRAAERVLAAQRQLVQLATVDPLTGVSNRRSFFNAANCAIQNKVASMPIFAIMLDIDHFKNINDTHGHDAGDVVLRDLAHRIGTDCSIFGRLGGEEFAALEVCGSEAEAYQIAETMRRKVGDMQVPTNGGNISVTCSIGIAVLNNNDDIDTLLRRADLALYAAKRGGRNKTEVYDSSCAANV